MGLEALTDNNVVVMREREEQDRVTTPIKNQSKVVKHIPAQYSRVAATKGSPPTTATKSPAKRLCSS